MKGQTAGLEWCTAGFGWRRMNVFFYWSGQEFDFGNLLSVASAALHSPDGVVVFVDEKPVGNPHFNRLSRLPEVRVEPVSLTSLMSAAHAELYRRMRFIAHRSDLVRFAVLAKYGGLYLDTDTLTRRSLATVGERLLFDDGEIVHIGMMSFAAGDPLPLRMMDEFLAMAERDLEVYPSIVHRWTRIVRQEQGSVRSGDIQAFAPVHWRNWESIFVPGGFDGDTEPIHVLHHYGYFSRRYTASMDVSWLEANPCLFSQVALPIVDELRARLDVDLRDGAAG